MVLVMVIAGACSAEGIPTKFAPVNESLEMLLNQGWTIVTGDVAGLILKTAVSGSLAKSPLCGRAVEALKGYHFAQH